ncbi:MAG: hypothetical protein R3F11_22870 [Verrucomicrobiales bacterium]
MSAARPIANRLRAAALPLAARPFVSGSVAGLARRVRCQSSGTENRRRGCLACSAGGAPGARASSQSDGFREKFSALQATLADATADDCARLAAGWAARSWERRSLGGSRCRTDLLRWLELDPDACLRFGATTWRSSRAADAYFRAVADSCFRSASAALPMPWRKRLH